MIIPDDVSYENAAALPEAWFTVWCNLIKLGSLKAHDTVLIHGRSGGVGIMVIQIAKALGAKVTTTVRNKAKAQAVTEAGADCLDRNLKTLKRRWSSCVNRFLFG